MTPDPLVVWQGRRYRVLVRLRLGIERKWWQRVWAPEDPACDVWVQRIDSPDQITVTYPASAKNVAEIAERAADGVRLVESASPEPEPSEDK